MVVGVRGRGRTVGVRVGVCVVRFGMVGAIDVAGVLLCVFSFFVFGLDLPGRFLVFGERVPALRYDPGI